MVEKIRLYDHSKRLPVSIANNSVSVSDTDKIYQRYWLAKKGQTKLALSSLCRLTLRSFRVLAKFTSNRSPFERFDFFTGDVQPPEDIDGAQKPLFSISITGGASKAPPSKPIFKCKEVGRIGVVWRCSCLHGTRAICLNAICYLRRFVCKINSGELICWPSLSKYFREPLHL